MQNNLTVLIFQNLFLRPVFRRDAMNDCGDAMHCVPTINGEKSRFKTAETSFAEMQFETICLVKPMSEKFKGKYRNKTVRLRNWDYSLGLYFVTIVTKNREPYFGKIVDGEMHLSAIRATIQKPRINNPRI